MKSKVKEKEFAALLSVLSNSVLIILKVIASVFSGSISILSEAIHSATDLLASFIAYFSVQKSSQPADKDHPFGHGKFEDMSGLFEGALIILAAFYILFEAIKKILTPHTINLNPDIGLYIMLFSMILNVLVSRYLFKIAKKHDSMALYADGEHLRTDVYSSLGVLIGLLAVKLTANPIFDAITAVIVAVIIFVAGYDICKRSVNNLLDKSLSDEDITKIQEAINKFLDGGILSVKSIKTRKSGMKKNIELVLIVEKSMTIQSGHCLCDKIEKEISLQLGNTDVNIHLEPNIN